jgi:hypothetical protein
MKKSSIVPMTISDSEKKSDGIQLIQHQTNNLNLKNFIFFLYKMRQKFRTYMTILVKNILLRTFSKEEIEMAKKKP